MLNIYCTIFSESWVVFRNTCKKERKKYAHAPRSGTIICRQYRYLFRAGIVAAALSAEKLSLTQCANRAIYFMSMVFIISISVGSNKIFIDIVESRF